ncbi:hypothetical protein [Faecalibacter sp. LW9]|uniref:hypothetical protein n=1 Tax=Faecalibacter sp. LW9 TaxID=3103144 RepID=UPI002AFF3D8D|nr:hypothetical protein [Faecalibacter sp. LW9]
MAKKSVLNKLSNQELEKYIASNSRYTSSAIELAKEILKERGKEFSFEELKRIEQLIFEKEKEEDLNEFEPNLVEDESNNEDLPRLFPKLFILFLSVEFSLIIGGYFLWKNDKYLNHNKIIIPVMIFSIISLVIDFISLPFLYENREAITEAVRRYDYILNFHEKYFYIILFFLIRFLYSLLFVDFMWNKYFGKDLRYKSKL